MGVRHYKQRFDPDADFIFIKQMVVHGKSVGRGDAVRNDDFPGGKLKRMWHAKKIALANWAPPRQGSIVFVDLDGNETPIQTPQQPVSVETLTAKEPVAIRPVASPQNKKSR